jgi:hypothetical protein
LTGSQLVTALPSSTVTMTSPGCGERDHGCRARDTAVRLRPL